MQLHLQLAGSFSLPLNYRHYVQSMIYDTLRSDPEYAAALHAGTNPTQSRRFKFFTFSQLEGSYRIADHRIHFPDGVSLEIRSIHEELLMKLLRSLTPGQQLRLGSSTPRVAQATLSNTTICCDTVLARTRSPIVAYITHPDGHTRFFSPEEPEFCALITTNARHKWYTLHGDDDDFNFHITPVVGSRFRKQVTIYKSTKITAWDGRFLLQGDPRVLDLLYHTGLGAKSSQGFGMFDVL